MARSNESRAAGRGARKRDEAHRLKARREALRWWTQPGVPVFLGAICLAAVGWLLVIQATRRAPVTEATIGGLHMQLNQARWLLDQMDHGENFQKPSTMMPDMPVWGSQRVTLDLTFHNRSSDALTYDGTEFFLVPELGDAVPPIGAQVGEAALGPGQILHTAIHFDFDTREPHGKLRAEWRRAGESVFLPIPEPAEHYHLRPRGGEVALPRQAQLVLPLGVPERGEQLFVGTYGCVACHGEADVPDSNNVGPHLAGVGSRASGRIPDMPPEQYLYESIISPDRFIAPGCKGGPCQRPTAMPEYASLMPLQDIADVLSYLVGLRDAELDAAGVEEVEEAGPEGAP